MVEHAAAADARASSSADMDDGDERKQAVPSKYVPNVPFTDTDKLWKGYDKEWSRCWGHRECESWVKRV